MTALSTLETPALLLDEPRMQANVARMLARLAALGVPLRPHVKTAKCVEVALAMCGGMHGPITVSTLREAERFAQAGFRDITYAVGISANKLPHVADLLARGVRLSVILDSVEAAQAVAGFMGQRSENLAVLIEIDTDGHRAGLQPEAPELLAVAAALQAPGVTLAGVLTHAGESYQCKGEAALRAMAGQERAGAVRAAQRLRAAGHAAPVVSVGSTPTALSATDLSGVTEVRAGVYVFFDLVMAGVGVCTPQQIALSVLTTVIGHQEHRGWTLCDAGWMALSRDRGTAAQAVDQGYGLVCDAEGRVIPDYIVSAVSQEHGTITHRSGDPGRGLHLPVGTMLRILPNHACATGAQHERYRVLDGSGAVTREWERFGGW
ncbi:MAG TPA: alanine racemase [Burkholderiaceae bacterium]|jgi:D-serine deaminase-like pyridoxal phosphate-dependent protein|nr:alanine racemase [Burkholderiaceae bacterium]